MWEKYRGCEFKRAGRREKDIKKKNQPNITKGRELLEDQRYSDKDWQIKE